MNYDQAKAVLEELQRDLKGLYDRGYTMTYTAQRELREDQTVSERLFMHFWIVNLNGDEQTHELQKTLGNENGQSEGDQPGSGGKRTEVPYGTLAKVEETENKK